MATRARVFRQPKSAMQSGHASEHEWVLEFERTAPREPDPIMGWWGSGDTRSQLRLKFDSREEVVAYCEREDIVADIEVPVPRVRKPKAYADNFKFTRLMNWTH